MTSAIAMTSVEAFNPPSFLAPYQSLISVGIGVMMTAFLLVIADRFDQTRGPLTISLLIVLGMIGSVAYCLIFTIPNDDITPGVVGGLTAGFGAVVAYWLGRHKDSD